MTIAVKNDKHYCRIMSIASGKITDKNKITPQESRVNHRIRILCSKHSSTKWAGIPHKNCWHKLTNKANTDRIQLKVAHSTTKRTKKNKRKTSRKIVKLFGNLTGEEKRCSCYKQSD